MKSKLAKLMIALATAVTITGVFSNPGSLFAQQNGKQKPQTYTNIEQVDEAYAYQGEYLGTLKIDDVARKYGLQVISMGKGKFKAVRYSGGLPGAGFDGKERYEFSVEGTWDPQASSDPIKGEKGLVRFLGEKHGDGILTKEGFTQMDRRGQIMGQFKKLNRTSKTLGAKPPSGAVVLYAKADDVENWQGGKASEDGFLMAGTTSQQKFGSQKLHIEFLLPYQPDARGQGRGNSGIYVQGRWEIQMLDSFGLTGEQNECGGIYSVAKPSVNMCLPPLVWQTYDLDFTAATYDSDGKLTTNARMTVFHNGVMIHEDVELPDRKTTAAPSDVGNDAGPIYLQNHGNPVVYRNIWVLEK